MSKKIEFAVVSTLLLLGWIFFIQSISADEVDANKPTLDAERGGWKIDMKVTNEEEKGAQDQYDIYDFHVQILTEGVTIIGTSVPEGFNWTAHIGPRNRSASFNTPTDGTGIPITTDHYLTFDIVTDTTEKYTFEWFTTNITGHTIDNGTVKVKSAHAEKPKKQK